MVARVCTQNPLDTEKEQMFISLLFIKISDGEVWGRGETLPLLVCFPRKADFLNSICILVLCAQVI